MAGATTGIMFAVGALDGHGRELELVLKLYRPDRTQPDSAWREARILDLLVGSGLPVPRAVALDRDGSGAGWPALLMTRVAGRVRNPRRDLGPWLRELAAVAARIHALPIAEADLPRYGLWGLEHPPAVPGWWSDPAVWEKAVQVFRGPMPDEPWCFIHRDLNPGNLLWRGSRVVGIVDWLHGCWGPPSADFAHCRINLWLRHGPPAAQGLLDACRAVQLDLPPYNRYWDIADAMSWKVDPKKDGEGFARRYESFVTAAVSALDTPLKPLA